MPAFNPLSLLQSLSYGNALQQDDQMLPPPNIPTPTPITERDAALAALQSTMQSQSANRDNMIGAELARQGYSAPQHNGFTNKLYDFLESAMQGYALARGTNAPPTRREKYEAARKRVAGEVDERAQRELQNANAKYQIATARENDVIARTKREQDEKQRQFQNKLEMRRLDNDTAKQALDAENKKADTELKKAQAKKAASEPTGKLEDDNDAIARSASADAVAAQREVERQAYVDRRDAAKEALKEIRGSKKRIAPEQIAQATEALKFAQSELDKFDKEAMVPAQAEAARNKKLATRKKRVAPVTMSASKADVSGEDLTALHAAMRAAYARNPSVLDDEARIVRYWKGKGKKYTEAEIRSAIEAAKNSRK